MSSFEYQLLCLTFFIITKFARADIVSGKCPKVSGAKFNCSEALRDFLEDYNPIWDSQINLRINGFLPSSPESKSLNVFAYDFGHVNISDYYAKLNCDRDLKMNILKINCGDLLMSHAWDLE